MKSARVDQSCGVVIFLHVLMHATGLYFGSPDIVSIFQPAMPVWTALFVVVAGVEPVPPLNRMHGLLKIFGIMFAAGGAVAMGLAHSDDSHVQNPLLGNLFAVANTLFFAVYMTAQKKYMLTENAPMGVPWRQLPIHVTAWSYGVFLHLKLVLFQGGQGGVFMWFDLLHGVMVRLRFCVCVHTGCHSQALVHCLW